MLVKANSFADFMPHERVIDNPYIGFKSFQHYDGEHLFDESIPGWKTELHPFFEEAEYVEVKSGYHPKCTIAYFRLCWINYEPQDGKYNDELVSSILEKAQKKGQSVFLRLMPHTARGADIPSWLAAQIPHPTRAQNDEEYEHRNEPWCHIKESPTHPMFYERFAQAIKHLGETFDNHPALFAVDISLVGSWGEGHCSDKVEKKHILQLADAYLDGFKTTQLLCQTANADLLEYFNSKRNVGIRADCLGDPWWHMNRFYPYIFAKNKDLWKHSHISFEVGYTLNTWLNNGWDINEIIEQSLKWHISSFNAKFRPCPDEWKPIIDRWLCKMGYRFALRNIKYPNRVSPGDNAQIEFWIENRGVAPIYKPLPFKFILKNENSYYEFDTNIDITSYLPGDNTEELILNIPRDIVPGEYTLSATIGGGDYPVVQFAMECENDGKAFDLVKIKVE